MTLTVFFSAPAVWEEYRDLLPGLLARPGSTPTW